MKDFYFKTCTSSLPENSKVPECDYAPLRVKKLVLRKKKNGQIQIKVNGEGKWIDAEYDEERKTVRFYA